MARASCRLGVNGLLARRCAEAVLRGGQRLSQSLRSALASVGKRKTLCAWSSRAATALIAAIHR